MINHRRVFSCFSRTATCNRQTDGHTHGTTLYTARSSLARLKCIFAYRIVKGFLLKGKGSPYSITERRVPELIPVLGSQPAGGGSHKPGGRLPLLSARPAVTIATLKKAATSFAAW